MAVRYGSFRIWVLCTSHLEPYCTSVPYFSSIFEAYRINVPYCTYVPYRTAILAFNYSQLQLSSKSLAYKSAISIHTFSVDFSYLLPPYRKIRRNVRKVWKFWFKERTNVPYHYKKGVPYQRTVLLGKNWCVPYRTCAYRTVLPSLLITLLR